MKRIRMVVFDIDGTVFPLGSATVSEETKKALLACKEAGIITSPCSGRSIFMIPEDLRAVINTDYVIYCNGAYIANPETGEIADSHTIDPQKVIGYFRAAEDESVYHKVSTFTRFLDDNPCRKPNAGIPTVFVNDICMELERMDEPLFKAEFFFQEGSAVKQQVKDMMLKEKDLAISSAFADNIEINNINATKGNAVRKLAGLYGLSLDEVMAIGDGDNDSSMLEAAGFSVAMGNGTKAIKNMADAVTDSVENEGFAKALYKYVLQKE